MRRFYEVFVRLAGTPLAEVDLATDVLAEWDQLELPDEVARITLVQGVVKMLSTGQGLTETEVVETEVGTLRVSKEEWDYLRAAFNNKRVDVMLVDPENTDMVVCAWGIQVNVVKLAESGNTITVKVIGKREISSEVTGAALSVLAAEPSGILWGYVRNEGGEPITEVGVTATGGGYTIGDMADKDGMYLLLLKLGTYYVCAVKSGYLFPEPQSVDIKAGKIQYNILGTPA